MSKPVAVLGAGTMGHGIALVAAKNGHETRLFDVGDKPLEAGLKGVKGALAEGVKRGKTTEEKEAEALANLEGFLSLEDAVQGAGVVIEAIPEDLSLKRATLGDVEDIVGEQALLASNTSSLSIEEIAEPLEHPDRFVGMHFFNPPYILDLVEVVYGPKTSEATVEEATHLARSWGKEPIQVRDVPGFASSRLGIALGLEAIRMVEQEVASPEAIDTAMELGYNHPMGPLKLTDLIGLDVRLHVAEYLNEELGDRFEPPALLREMVEAGKLGKKTGEGFYTYEGT